MSSEVGRVNAQVNVDTGQQITNTFIDTATA